MSSLRTKFVAEPARAERPHTARRLTLGQSTTLVVDSIIGVGVLSLPYALSSYGPISLVAMGHWPRSAPSVPAYR
jgi:hypothetical protein